MRLNIEDDDGSNEIEKTNVKITKDNSDNEVE